MHNNVSCMLPFYLIFLILSLSVFVDISTFSAKQKSFFYFIVYIILVLFAGLRATSPDYDNYAEVFKILGNKQIINVDITSVANDPGYMSLNKLVAQFTTNPVFLFLLVAVLSIGFNLHSYKKYTPFFFTAVLLYFVHTFVAREMMQIRAGLACAICLYSIQFIIRKQKWKFLLTVLIASLFHLVAICFLLTYILCSMNLSLKIWKSLIAASIFIGVFCPLGQFIKMIPAMDILERIQNYNTWEEYNGSLGVFSNPTVLKELFITLLCILYFKKLLCFPGFKIFFDIYALSLCWLVCFSDYGIFCARIATVFSIIEVIICSYFYALVPSRSRWTASVMLILFAFLVMSLNIYTGRFFYYKLVV